MLFVAISPQQTSDRIFFPGIFRKVLCFFYFRNEGGVIIFIRYDVRKNAYKRRKTGQPGYDNIKININAIMDGDAKSDVQVGQGDIIVVSEGVF